LEIAFAFFRRKRTGDTFPGKLKQIFDIESVNLHCIVVTSAGQALAIRAKGHAIDTIRVAAQGYQLTFMSK
jgi:hypothetical protein